MLISYLSINKKDLEAFYVIQKALKLKPDNKVLLESSADYARKAFGDVFAKKYIDDLIDKYGFSDKLLSLLSEVHLNLSLPETEIDKLKQKSEPKNLVSKNNEILRNFGTLLAPNVQLMDIDNNLVDLHNLKGKRVFIYFWAMWCGPCRAAMPTLMELKEKYKDVNFILIDTWEKDKKVQGEIKAFLVKNKYTFKVLLDSKYHAADLFKIEALPTKFLIDQNGNFELLNPTLNDLDTYLGKKH
jgi:thiol-disulfide isomerase/thioredoxin